MKNIKDKKKIVCCPQMVTIWRVGGLEIIFKNHLFKNYPKFGCIFYHLKQTNKQSEKKGAFSTIIVLE